METTDKFKVVLVAVAVGLVGLISIGLILFFRLDPNNPIAGFWYLFSYAAGLTMIVLPCTLPLAFVIVPLSMGKGAAKGLGIAVMFGLGVVLMLSTYGLISAAIGKSILASTGASVDIVKNWFYFIAGVFAYLFAVGEIGLLNVRMPTYTGAAPSFIQRQPDYVKALLLGLFLGNIGVGCPHPATPFILGEIATSGNIAYGWFLFLIHAIGRVLPLILLAVLGILGINGLKWLVARKDKIERATGWGMVYVAAFILVLGLFTHAWWVNSGQHTLLEEITQEERFLGVIANKLQTAAPHEHGPEEGPGLLGLPLGLGNWVLVGLWILPMWWYYGKKKKSLAALPESERASEERIMSYRFWLITVFSLLLILTFTWVLPDRFLNHTDHGAHAQTPGAMTPAAGGHEHGGAMVHEEADILEGLAVSLSLSPTPVMTGMPTQFDFFVNEKPMGTPVPIQSLEINQEKLMHVIGIRDDMNEFFHIHPYPTSTPGVMTITGMIGNSGRYKIWSEITKDGTTHIIGHAPFTVEGEGPTSEKKVDFSRNVIVEDYQVSLIMDEPVGKGVETDLQFDVHTLTGNEVLLGNYLGTTMHLSIIKDDLRQFIHTHPESGAHSHSGMWIPEARANGADPNHASSEAAHGVNFHVAFPEAGLYKAFAQFRPEGANLPDGVSYTVNFWIQVEERQPWLTNWWLYLGVSILLIGALSWATKKYISV